MSTWLVPWLQEIARRPPRFVKAVVVCRFHAVLERDWEALDVHRKVLEPGVDGELARAPATA